VEIQLRTAWTGQDWHGFADNVTIGFVGRPAVNFNFEISPRGHSPVIVLPGDPDWFAYAAAGSTVAITGSNPYYQFGSLELTKGIGDVSGFARQIPLPGFGAFGDLDRLNYDWFIDAASSRLLPPEIWLRVYPYGDPRSFFLYWNGCSAAACPDYPAGTWQTTSLTGRLLIAPADGNPPPASVADIPPDAPIIEIHVRSNWAVGQPWHGFVDSVTVGFRGLPAVTYDFEVLPPRGVPPVYVLPDDGTWFAYTPPDGSAEITAANPQSGSGSLELIKAGADSPVLIREIGAPGFGLLGDLDVVNFDWFIDPASSDMLPPDIALRVYAYGDPRSFFLHWAGCDPLACGDHPAGSWQTTNLITRLSIQPADGNPAPLSLADVPPDAPIVGIHLRASYAGGQPWHGFVDNVTIGFSGQPLTTYNFEVTPPGADLAVAKSDGATTAVPGQAITYTITVTNNGPGPVTGATVTDTIPAALMGATWTCVGTGGGSCAPSGSGNIADAAVNLPVGASATYTLDAVIDSAATGSVSNTATAATPAGIEDPAPGNNTATDTDTLTPQADLAVTKTDGQTTAVPGEPVTYTIVVTNNGPSNASGTTVNDTVPAALTSASWSCAGTAGGSCTSSGAGSIADSGVDLPVGATVTYLLTATVDRAATGLLSNSASAATASGITDPVTANSTATDTDTLTPRVELAITKTDGQTSAVVGQPIAYTITVTNAGPSDVTGARVVDDVPALIDGATWTCTGSGNATCVASGSGDIDSSANVPVGGIATYVLQGTVNLSGSGTLVNTATVSAPSGVTDTTPGNNTASDSDVLIDLTPPTIAVTQPNGGEILFTGSPYVIQWTAADNVALGSFDVLASTNGGTSYTPITGCSGLGPAVRSCTWTSPGPTTTLGRISVTARDASGNTASDASNANFTIQGASGSINVTSPNTSVTWIVGMTHQLTWSHNLGASSAVNIEISRDAGATWSPLAAAVPNATATAGAFNWEVSGPATTQGLVRVSWTANAAVADQSNTPFKIETGFLKVTQPDTPPPTNWKTKQFRTIKWNRNMPSSELVKIEFSADDGSTWSVVVSAVANTGTYADFRLPDTPTDFGRVRVSWTRHPSVSDVSDVPFVVH
jgi:uncharacterized repeat protein (TIGR01451 family)